ncbi:MAG: RDD family protein [Verrucomicrobia bacterium]|nr:RDD family protein [Verrucomicrobiota bacterium]
MDSVIITAGSQQYRVAGWPRRVVARGLDFVVIIVGCCVAGEYLSQMLDMVWLLGARSVSGRMAGAFVVPVGIIYLFLGNGLMKGASLGKRVMGLKVIDARHGGPCGVLQDFLRQRYIFSGNPISLVLTFYDSVADRLLEQETYVVHATPLTLVEREVPPEKPAKLDLAGMGETLKKLRETRDLAAPRDE